MSSANSPRGHDDDASPGRGGPPLLVAGDAMDGQAAAAAAAAAAAEEDDVVRKSGYLRKHKSMHRRYFVLRSGTECGGAGGGGAGGGGGGAARLEYYESEKKFRGKAPVPKKAVPLETCFNINKRADSKNKHMIVLYTRAESFAVAADNQADQDDWYQAMVDLQCKSKNPSDKGAAGDYGVPNPGPAFKEVWQVKVWPKGLGQAKNLVGIYRLCLTDKTINFVKLNSDAAAVVLQLMNVRRCGHSENFFFVEVGRSAVTGPGEFWMQVDDSVVAQNMHETLLEAMKALSEEFRQRSKSQSNSGPGGGATASNPISVPTRRHHSNPPPSQVGFTRRPRTEPPGGAGPSGASASPTPRHGFPRSRAASDGSKNEEGLAGVGGSSPSANGSCSGTPVLRSKLTRPGSASTAKTPLGLMRSVSTPAPSPGPSLSSSSGHGSEFGAAAPCASVSGSPSDYGSSDEYGSSPEEQTLLVSPGPPGSSAGSAGSRSLGEDGAHYILMGQHSGGASGSHPTTSSSLPAAVRGSQAHARRVLRRSSSRECEAERRLLSKRASLPPMALERLAPPRQQRGEEPAEDDSADYAIMSRSASRESFSSGASSAAQREPPMGAGSAEGGGAYFDLAGEFKGQAGSSGAVDNGYMSMLPGVTRPPASSSQSPAISVPDSDPKAPDDYMAMTPNSSVSPPRPIRPPPAPDGYMIMSPSSSCSPDQRGGGLSSGAWVGSGSADSRAGSDYMNMSPISARSVNGSPPPSRHSHSESQQPLPKMVYSYYSLPRSYKHNPSSRHFDDGAGRGRRPNGGGGGGRGAARTVGGHPEQAAAGASVPGRHLSLSSSSYSSSSASSESLGESEERASSRDGSELQRRRGSGGAPKHGIHSRSRPVSLFVDVSKANTLPRVRENPLPPEPKSPGEYVSIEFKGEKNAAAAGRRGQGRGLGHGSSSPGAANERHPQHRPASCLGAFAGGSHSRSGPVTPPAASEYVNMDLGPSPSPSPSPHTPLVFPPFHTPPTPPTLAPASAVAESGPGGPREEAVAAMAEAALRKIREMVPESRCPASCGDYTVMAFNLNDAAAARSSSPEAPSPNRTELSMALRGLDFPLAKSGPNPDHGAKVIRADPQGRRRHCSESFLASSSLSAPASTPSSSAAAAAAASLSPEQAGPQRPGFESASRRNCAVSEAPAQSALPGQQRSATPTPGAEQGLNYIDLDLANKESPHLAPDGPPGTHASGRLFSASSAARADAAAVGNGSAAVNSYASIDFYKSEELRTHPNGNKEGTEC